MLPSTYHWAISHIGTGAILRHIHAGWLCARMPGDFPWQILATPSHGSFGPLETNTLVVWNMFCFSIYGGFRSHGGTPSYHPFWMGFYIISHPFWVPPFWETSIFGIIIPTEFHIFQRGGSTTNQLVFPAIFLIVAFLSSLPVHVHWGSLCLDLSWGLFICAI